jgi:hypothetical protein
MSEIFGFDAFSPREIAQRIEQVGVAKARLPLRSMWMLGMLAGAFIGLGALYYTLVAADASLGFAARQLLGGVTFSLGLLLVTVAGAELFTGNNLLVLAWADGRISAHELLRNWVVVCLANFVGAAALALLRIALGADGQRVAELRQAQHGEHHALPVGAAVADRPGLQQQAHRTHGQADPDDVLPHAVGEDALRGARGGRCMMLRSARSAGQRQPGRPSVTRLIQRMWIGSSGIGRPRKGARKMVQISPELLVIVYLMNLRMLSKMRRPSRTACTMVAKLSSSSTMCAASRRRRCRPAHRHADVGRLQRRRIVHAVAGHGGEFAGRLQRADDADLLLRVDAGVDADVLHLRGEVRVGEGGQLDAADDAAALVEDAEPLGDGARRGRMVAGDHHRHDAGVDGIRRRPAAASSRGGSIRPTRPRKVRSLSASSMSAGSASSRRSAKASTRSPRAAPGARPAPALPRRRRRTGPRAVSRQGQRSSIGFRRALDAGEEALWERLPAAISPCSACTVAIRLRSESKGNSPCRGD